MLFPSLLMSLLAPIQPAIAGDWRLTIGATVDGISGTPPAVFAGVAAGDSITAIIEVFDPPLSTQGVVARYDIDYINCSMQIGSSSVSRLHPEYDPPRSLSSTMFSVGAT